MVSVGNFGNIDIGANGSILGRGTLDGSVSAASTLGNAQAAAGIGPGNPNNVVGGLQSSLAGAGLRIAGAGAITGEALLGSTQDPFSIVAQSVSGNADAYVKGTTSGSMAST